MSDLTKQAEETMWAETEAHEILTRWNRDLYQRIEGIATALRAAEARGIERAAKWHDEQYATDKFLADRWRADGAIEDMLEARTSGNFHQNAALRIRSLLPAEQRPAKKGETT
jgi:hypothetical protein